MYSGVCMRLCVGARVRARCTGTMTRAVHRVAGTDILSVFPVFGGESSDMYQRPGKVTLSYMTTIDIPHSDIMDRIEPWTCRWKASALTSRLTKPGDSIFFLMCSVW